MDINIHAYWHMSIEAAKRFGENDPNQCALAVELLYLRGVTLEHNFENELVPAYASNGQKIWVDLPYFYDNLQAAFRTVLQETNERILLPLPPA